MSDFEQIPVDEIVNRIQSERGGTVHLVWQAGPAPVCICEIYGGVGVGRCSAELAEQDPLVASIVTADAAFRAAVEDIGRDELATD
jgi:hypothetical protein